MHQKEGLFQPLDRARWYCLRSGKSHRAAGQKRTISSRHWGSWYLRSFQHRCLSLQAHKNQELKATTQPTPAPKQMPRSVCDLLCRFWMVGPPMGPTLKKVFGQLDWALQNFARLHLMARGLEPDPASTAWNWIWKGR